MPRPSDTSSGQRLRPLAISLRSVHILKNLFRHRKTRYRGLAKNTAQLHSLFALANLFIARRSPRTAGCIARIRSLIYSP